MQLRLNSRAADAVDMTDIPSIGHPMLLALALVVAAAASVVVAPPTPAPSEGPGRPDPGSKPRLNVRDTRATHDLATVNGVTIRVTTHTLTVDGQPGALNFDELHFVAADGSLIHEDAAQSNIEECTMDALTDLIRRLEDFGFISIEEATGAFNMDEFYTCAVRLTVLHAGFVELTRSYRGGTGCARADLYRPTRLNLLTGQPWSIGDAITPSLHDTFKRFCVRQIKQALDVQWHSLDSESRSLGESPIRPYDDSSSDDDICSDNVFDAGLHSGHHPVSFEFGFRPEEGIGGPRPARVELPLGQLRRFIRPDGPWGHLLQKKPPRPPAKSTR